MTKTPIFKPQWLDIINCCGQKTQLSIISAIVKYQAEGTLPDFKGIKLALFLALVRDIDDTQSAEQHDISTEAPAKDDTDNNPDTDDNPQRHELTPEEKRVSDQLLSNFLSDKQAVSKVLLPHSIIPRGAYPELLEGAMYETPPSPGCLTSPRAFLDYIIGRTRDIARKFA